MILWDVLGGVLLIVGLLVGIKYLFDVIDKNRGR